MARKLSKSATNTITTTNHPDNSKPQTKVNLPPVETANDVANRIDSTNPMPAPNIPDIPTKTEPTPIKLTYVQSTEPASQSIAIMDNIKSRAKGELTAFSVASTLRLATDIDKYSGFKSTELNNLATAAKAVYRVGNNTEFSFVRELSMVLASVTQSQLKAEGMKTIADFAKRIGLPEELSSASLSNLTTYGRMQLDKDSPDQLRRMTPSMFAAVAALMKDAKHKETLYADAGAGKLTGKTQKELREYRDRVKGKSDSDKALNGEVVDMTEYKLTIVGDFSLDSEHDTWIKSDIDSLDTAFNASGSIFTNVSDAPIDGAKALIYTLITLPDYVASTFIFKAVVPKVEPEVKSPAETVTFIDLDGDSETVVRAIMTKYGYSRKKALAMYAILSTDDDTDDAE